MCTRLPTLLLLGCLLGCNAAMPNRPVALIAHRGASRAAPENTLAAFELGWAEGANGIEGDFWLTADRRVVSIHDADTKRTGDRTLDVQQSTLADLQLVDVGSWKDAQFAGERAPSLDAVFESLPPTGVIFIELKDGSEVVEPTLAALEASGVDPGRVSIISFDEAVVQAAQRARHGLTVNWLTAFEIDEQTGEVTPTIDTIIATLDRIDADGLGCKAADHIDAAWVAALRDAGYPLHVWTVDDPEVAARFIDLGVESITTNRPGYLRKDLLQAGYGDRLVSPVNR